MRTIYDIQQLLKQFGTFIYVGDRLAELELMEQEIQELNQAQFITKEDYQMAILLLRTEIARMRDERKGEISP
ncbi:YqgQ family protein [Halobacillus shinanisalinarum]|uniref:YqgQ family protein n=1 Tax=Halobacillus shinanisalinarum TaxID=2932258 RepID=A0ABY4GZY2_9BACI|nr:YqgQ family protein [Halobacillus shinanisalinarum]UOQ93733.1 YqgQ family protein [Halobacillus shinanisalinarum]